MIKAVIFDLDGTLLDTLPDIRAHLNAALAQFGCPAVSSEEVRRFVGDGAKKLVERALPKDFRDADACYARFRAAFAESDNSRTRLFDGEEETLKALCGRGLKLAVVTNKPQDATEGCVRKFFPALPFSFVGGDSGTFPVKPDPSLARYAALSMRLPPAECAFVGDGETDVLTAKRAGMLGISVLWGYRSREQLEKAGATLFAENFRALQKILEKKCV